MEDQRGKEEMSLSPALKEPITSENLAMAPEASQHKIQTLYQESHKILGSSPGTSLRQYFVMVLCYPKTEFRGNIIYLHTRCFPHHNNILTLI